MTTDSFPRQYARTRRFSLGEPRDLRISPDDSTVFFARSKSGSDPVTCLWACDSNTGRERLIVDPSELNADSERSDAERAVRERLRESAEGITSYDTDHGCTTAVFTMSGSVFWVDLATGELTAVDVGAGAFDPRLSPDGQHLAVVTGTTFKVVSIAAPQTPLIELSSDSADTRWGVAEFIAAEEMGRMRGHWWSPDGTQLLVARVDNSPVSEWSLSDPAQPWAQHRSMKYPAAGTANATATFHLVDLSSGALTPVEWDAAAFEYVARASWDSFGPLLTVQSRDQRTLNVLRVDPIDGSTTAIWHDEDEHWVELVPGTPVGIGLDNVVTAADRDGARRLIIDGEPVTPADLQVRSVIHAHHDGVLFTANPIDNGTVQHLWVWHRDRGLSELVGGDVVAQAAGTTEFAITKTADLHHAGQPWTLPNGHQLASFSEHPLCEPHVTIARGIAEDGHALDVAILLPSTPITGPLPVLVDPYGGPHALRVVRSQHAHLNSQWFADQGFAVVICDGRGTPGRGSSWERAVHGDLASPVLDDQVTALDIAAKHCETHLGCTLDLSRVAIRGWSFGGYLSALAVMRRPDRFHVAVAGAPVTEWRWYDTHYTERYLGNPAVDDTAYRRSSLIEDLESLERPLLLVHGLADDNVVAAHTLQLSSALLSIGAPHSVLPLAGVSHMTPQEVVAEHLLNLQLDFIRQHLSSSQNH
ncbi:MAG: prolyl oligopeptidase family serine peptidase [Ilumatobacteraceae bacterium]